MPLSRTPALAWALITLSLLLVTPAFAQFSGARGGVHGVEDVEDRALSPLSPEIAQSYITIEGQVELRVEPSELRVVLAITAEGDTAEACRKKVAAQITALTAAWLTIGVHQKDIVEDFISVLPRYEFELKKVQGQSVAMEKKSGYLMQSNLHLAVANDAEALSVLNVAFANGVTDIIAIDYWSDDLDAVKIEARKQAIEAARAKADVLLNAFFPSAPPVINLQESTRVYYPRSMYESFQNSHDGVYSPAHYGNQTPEIKLFRPKNTYYRGLYPDMDVRSRKLPMRSEISVVSSVRLYFASPAAAAAP